MSSYGGHVILLWDDKCKNNDVLSGCRGKGELKLLINQGILHIWPVKKFHTFEALKHLWRWLNHNSSPDQQDITESLGL